MEKKKQKKEKGNIESAIYYRLYCVFEQDFAEEVFENILLLFTKSLSAVSVYCN